VPISISREQAVADGPGVLEIVQPVHPAIDQAPGGLQLVVHQHVLDLLLTVTQEQAQQVAGLVGWGGQGQALSVPGVVRPAVELHKSPAREGRAVERTLLGQVPALVVEVDVLADG
jgi:hypothetical protein